MSPNLALNNNVDSLQDKFMQFVQTWLLNSSRISPALLMRKLKVNPDKAAILMEILIHKGVVDENGFKKELKD